MRLYMSKFNIVSEVSLKVNFTFLIDSCIYNRQGVKKNLSRIESEVVESYTILLGIVSLVSLIYLKKKNHFQVYNRKNHHQ